MSQSGLEQFGAYQKARRLFDLVLADMEKLRGDPRCYRLIPQQVACVDSIAANIEEGYGRLSRVEYVRFLDFARGSARETRGRYKRMTIWLTEDVVAQRLTLIDEIIGILTASIITIRKQVGKLETYPNTVREDAPIYGINFEDEREAERLPPSPHDTLPSALYTPSSGGSHATN